MHSNFTLLDWSIFLGYLLLLGLSSYLLSRQKITSTQEYFSASNTIPTLAAAISLLATTQSAATFLGVPQFAYAKDFTLIGFYLSSLLAVLFIAKFFVPRFFAMQALTVYELLEKRYGSSAKKQAGVMFLIGRVLTSGARLYIAALAVSMILFLDISFFHMLIATLILIAGALLFTYFGGVRSVIYSDILQAVLYIGAGIIVAFYLYNTLDDGTIFQTLHDAGKLKLLDTSFDGKFSIFGLLGGWLLLNIAAYGLDQDMAQRMLACKDSASASRSLILSILFTIPVVLLFLFIGALLYLHYQNIDVAQQFHGEKITIFMYYILSEMPSGLKGLVTVGAIAAALSSTNSVLGAMASVAVEDIYKPFKLTKHPNTPPSHFLSASRLSVLGFAVLLVGMALVSYVWQRTFHLSLISYALGVMAFAYTGLLGVYFAALFTKRGNKKTVFWGFVGGFATVLALQPYTFGLHIGFDWQIVAGTIVAFLLTVLPTFRIFSRNN